MAFAVLNSLSLVFMVAGATLWLTSLGLARRAKRFQARMHGLLQLASQEVEPLEIPAAAWPTLQAAGWQSLVWEGNWYGQPVHGLLGKPLLTDAVNNAIQTHHLGTGTEAHLYIHMQHSAPGGEQRLFATQLAQVFLLLLETRLRERTGALSAALAERARLSLYLQHDMRNMTQWVAWVSADFAAAQDTPALLQAAQRLKTNAPLAQERAARLNAALGQKPQADVPQDIDVRHALQQAAHLAGVTLEVEGQAHARIAPEAMARVLDNLLSNLASEWREGRLAAPRAVLASQQLSLHCPLSAQGIGMPPEKLFEPFASGRPGGLGLGLYQARKSLRDAGGELLATVHNNSLQFDLQLPACVKNPDT